MKIEKRPLTLLEIMIVIAIIALVSGVIGFSMKGSLDKGKYAKTELAKEKIHSTLLYELSLHDNYSGEYVASHSLEVLKNADYIKEPKKLLKDGWGDEFSIVWSSRKNDFSIASKKLDKYKKDHGIQEENDESDEY